MKITRQITGRLNLDASKHRIAAGDYYAGRNITLDGSGDGADGVISGLKGNKKIAYSGWVAGDKVIGVLADTFRNMVITIIYRASGSYFLKYSAGVYTLIYTDTGNTIFGFTQSGYITSINIIYRPEGDLLYFLDTQGRPTVIDIDKIGTYATVTRAMVDVATALPPLQPIVVYDSDTNKRVNSLRNNLFRFRYRWVYDDYRKSVWSPYSKVPFPQKPLDDTFTNVPYNNNVINVTVNSGAKNITKVEIGMQYSLGNVWSDLCLVETVDKSIRSIGDNTDFIFRFYNDAAYPPVLLKEAVLPNDYVPIKAGSQELVNGNTLVYADITEGYNHGIDPYVEIEEKMVAAGSASNTGSLIISSTKYQESSTGNIWRFEFSGTPKVGSTVYLKTKVVATGVIRNEGIYTVQYGDTPLMVAEKLGNYINVGTGNSDDVEAVMYSVFEFPIFVEKGLEVRFLDTTKEIYSAVVVDDGTTASTDVNSICTWPWGDKRRFGLIYFDEKGRTNGVITKINLDNSSSASNIADFEVTLPAYKEIAGIIQVPYLSAKIYHQPPLWATSYAWVVNKGPMNFLFWISRDVKTDSDYIYFDITNLTANKDKNPTTADVITYDFAKGDRMRLIRKQSDGTVYDDTYDAEVMGVVVDPKINGIDNTGSFAKIKKVAPFTIDYASKFFVIQLYSPVKPQTADTEPYFEFGQNYKILNAGTATRAHDGSVQAQNITLGTPAEFDFYEGDVYFRQRKVSHNADNDESATFYVMDKNFVDTYKSAVSSISGRPSVVDLDAKQTRYHATARFSEAYQENTNINGANRFYPENLIDFNASFGPVKRMKSRDGEMRVFQQLKCGSVPVYQAIQKTADGQDVLTISDKLLNPIQYRAGDFGIGNCPESLASNNFADYFIDSGRGVICRWSLDGITPISILYGVNAWATRELIVRGSGARAYGVFDAEFNRYILALEASGSSEAQTISFHEPRNAFEGLSDLYPEAMVCLGTLLISFKNGQMWTHDSDTYCNFFGTQYKPSVSIAFNDRTDIKKFFKAIAINANVVWECTIDTSLGQQSTLISGDFRKDEGMYYAPLLRDANSPKGLIAGDTLKGGYIAVEFTSVDGSVKTEFISADIIFSISNLNTK